MTEAANGRPRRMTRWLAAVVAAVALAALVGLAPWSRGDTSTTVRLGGPIDGEPTSTPVGYPSVPQDGSESQSEGSDRWVLVRGTTEDGALFYDEDSPGPITLDMTDGHVVGFALCSRYSTLLVYGRTSGTSSGLRGCEDLTATEESLHATYMRTLSWTSDVEESGERLRLSDSRGAELLYELRPGESAGDTTGSPNTTASPNSSVFSRPTPTPFAGKGDDWDPLAQMWLLTAGVSTDAGTFFDGTLSGEISLIIGGDGHASGRGGCNSFRTAIVDGRFEPIVAGDRVCSNTRGDVDIMFVEGEYLAALQKVDTIVVDDNELTLTGGGATLAFRVGFPPPTPVREATPGAAAVAADAATPPPTPWPTTQPTREPPTETLLGATEDGRFRYYAEVGAGSSTLYIDRGTGAGLQPAQADSQDRYSLFRNGDHDIEFTINEDVSADGQILRTVELVHQSGSALFRYVGRITEDGTIVDVHSHPPAGRGGDHEGDHSAFVSATDVPLDVEVAEPLIDLHEHRGATITGSWYRGRTLSDQPACGASTLYANDADGWRRVLPEPVEIDTVQSILATPVTQWAGADASAWLRFLAMSTMCPESYDGVQVVLAVEIFGGSEGSHAPGQPEVLVDHRPVVFPGDITEVRRVLDISIGPAEHELTFPSRLLTVEHLDGSVEEVIIDQAGVVRSLNG